MTVNSVSADQVLYGWAENRGKSGFQFISSSSALVEDDFRFLEKHSLPFGMDNLKFKEGRRLMLLPSGKVAMNFVKNIGKDVHGREGALYSHFLILDQNNFVGARKNLEELDRHHLKGITSVKDLDKLKLPNGNFMDLPTVNIEIDVKDESYGEDLLAQANKEYSRDVVYGLFLNIFQNEIKVGVISPDFISMFKQISTLESLFPPWIVFTYSTYDYTPPSDELIFDMVGTMPKVENNSQVLINPILKKVILPGEDSLIRTVSNEYLRLIETGKIYEFSNAYDVPSMGNRSKISNYLISKIIKSICKNAEPSQAISTAFKVAEMGTYGTRDEYYNIIDDIVVKSGYRDDLIDTAIDYMEKDLDDLRGRSDSDERLMRLIPVLIKSDPHSVGGRNLIQFLKSASSVNPVKINDIIVRELLKEDSNINMGKSIFTAIPSIYKAWAKVIMTTNPDYIKLSRSLAILKDFELARKDLFDMFDIALTENKFDDLDSLKNILHLIGENNEAFDQKKMYYLLMQVQKRIKKKKILLPPDLDDILNKLIGPDEDEANSRKRFHLR
ncbi:MAG: hypothetical protein ACYCSO_01640 [Cuniculiplasma sp.]